MTAADRSKLCVGGPSSPARMVAASSFGLSVVERSILRQNLAFRRRLPSRSGPAGFLGTIGRVSRRRCRRRCRGWASVRRISRQNLPNLTIAENQQAPSNVCWLEAGIVIGHATGATGDGSLLSSSTVRSVGGPRLGWAWSRAKVRYILSICSGRAAVVVSRKMHRSS